nr:semaphorin-4E-like isoform X3 [Syngnathus scovelli]
MSPMMTLLLRIVCAFILYGSFCDSNVQPWVARKTIPYPDNLVTFREDGMNYYNAMLIMEELGLLMVGARDALFALDINNISAKMHHLNCHNYIRSLHQTSNSAVQVCGTNAMSPRCDSLYWDGGHLEPYQQYGVQEGLCSSLPFDGYASVRVGQDLYAATTGKGSSLPQIRRRDDSGEHVEFPSEWLKDTINFVHMDFLNEERMHIYLVFSGVVRDGNGAVRVSQLTCVPKDNSGSSYYRSLARARLNCVLPGQKLPSVVESAYLLKDDQNWQQSRLYAVFTSQLDGVSTVCAYNMESISSIFRKDCYEYDNGPAKRLDLEIVPQLMKKGAALGQIVGHRVSTLDGERRDVVFIGTGKKDAILIRELKVSERASERRTSGLLAPPPADGFIQKAVFADGEVFVIEEIQVFPSEPIRTLRLLTSKGQLYASSDAGVVQIPVSDCARYHTCLDCLLARDPYCAWELLTNLCSAVASLSNLTMAIQSLNAVSACPLPGPVAVVNKSLAPGVNMLLPCQASSNLAQVHWRFANRTLESSAKYRMYSQGLVIMNASDLDVGLYTCQSSEVARDTVYSHGVVAAYYFTASERGGGGGSSHSPLLICVLWPPFVVSMVLLFVLCLSLAAFIVCKWRRQVYTVRESKSEYAL